MITIVLLPGMDGTGDMFADFVAALEPTLDVRVVRYPCTDVLDYAELELLARTALPSEGSFVIVGESFSGPIAISLAASAPAGLIGLVLCCSFARNPHPIFTPLRQLAGLLPLGLVPMRVLSYLLLGVFSTTKLRSALAQSLAKVAAATLRQRAKAVLSVDVSATLKKLKVPLLYLRASQDQAVPATASHLITALYPNTCIEELNAPHLLLQVRPREAAEIVCSFVRRLEEPI